MDQNTQRYFTPSSLWAIDYLYSHVGTFVCSVLTSVTPVVVVVVRAAHI